MKINVVRHLTISRKGFPLITGVLAMISFFSCNPEKKLPKGEYLLNRNKIIYRFGSAEKAKGLTTDIADIGKEGIEKFEIPQRIAPSQILPYVKQKPNTKIFFVFPFYLYLYNLPDSVNTAKAKERRDSAYIIKARRKGWKDEKLKRKMDRRTGREWIMSQGEAPIVLDSALTQKSTEQIKTFLFNKGYFNAEVKDSVHISGQKADISYIIKPGKPYKIKTIQYLFEDPTLAAEICSDTVNSKIKKNEIYDQDILDGERDRITAELNNSGYYYFSKQYVSYTLDTNSKTHFINVTINIKKFLQRDKIDRDSTIEINHILFHIRHVTVQMDYDPTKVSFYHAGDSISYQGLIIVYPDKQQCLNPAVLKPKIFVIPGDVYRASNKEDTYTGLSQLNEFSYISIKYTPVNDSNYVDCYIQLMPVVKHSFGADFELTNTGGDAGTEGDVSYENYNQFNGAEKLIFKINGGFIAQQGFTSKTGNFLFNTANLGPEVDLAIPRPGFPFSLFHFARKVNPQTSIKLSFNYEERPDYYLRHVLGASYSFDYDPVKNQHITIALLEVNLVNASLNSSFSDSLKNYNLYFQNSFKSQLITDSRVSWTYTTQNPNKRQRHFSYIKFNIENSGFDLFALQHLGIVQFPMGSDGYYISGLPPYSQYVKGDIEYRHYFIQGTKQKYVFRFLAGVGLPYDNSSAMPYTKSFWAGGSNDIRAWQIQTLGPGASPSSPDGGEVGETKLEGNVEYRVNLIKYFDFAWFIDAGNIWLIRSPADEGLPLAYMNGIRSPNPFYNEIAIGTGPGFRFDFNYFVFRVDLGLPVKDPSLPAQHRILSFDESLKRVVLNIGVGYPF